VYFCYPEVKGMTLRISGRYSCMDSVCSARELQKEAKLNRNCRRRTVRN
jgi:hypothetical protein